MGPIPLLWLLLCALTSHANVIRSGKQVQGIVRVDKIDYVAFPVAPGVASVTFSFIMDASKFHPKVLVRRDGLPTPSLFDSKFDMRSNPEGVIWATNQVQPGVYYFGFWGGELLYSYQYFAGPEDNVRYGVLMTTSRCSNELMYGTNCDQRAHYIPLNDAGAASPLVLDSTTRFDESSFVGRIFVNHDVEMLDVQTNTVLTLPGWGEMAQLTLYTRLYPGVSRAAEAEVYSDEMGYFVVPENSTEQIARTTRFTVTNPRAGLWTVEVALSAMFGNETVSATELLIESVQPERWCRRSAEQDIGVTCPSHHSADDCEMASWLSSERHSQNCEPPRRRQEQNPHNITGSVSVQADAGSCSEGNVGFGDELEVEYTTTTVTDFGNGTVIEEVESGVTNKTCDFQQSGVATTWKGGKLIARYASPVTLLQTQKKLVFTEVVGEYNQSTTTEATISMPWPYTVFQMDLRDAPVGANARLRLYVQTLQGLAEELILVKMRCGALPDRNFSVSEPGSIVFNPMQEGHTTYDESTAGRTSTITIVRPALAQQYDVTGRCHFLVGPASPPLDPVWAANIRLRLGFDECASTCVHGSCDTIHGDTDVAMCVCRYPYGGEDCSERAISKAQYELHVSLLVVTNFAMVPGVLVAAHRRLYGIAAVLLSSSIASMFYHLCDVDAYCFAGMGFRTLQIMDMYGAFYSMLLMVLYFANLPAEKMWASAMVISPVLMLFVVDSTDTAVFVSVALVCGVVVTLTAWAYAWHLAAVHEVVVVKDWQMDSGVRTSADPILQEQTSYWTRYRRTVVNFFRRGNNFCYWRVLLGLAFVIAAFVCFGTMTRTNYWYVHSMWHIFVMGSTFLFITGRTRGPYQVFTGTDKIVDTAPPMEVTEAHPVQLQQFQSQFQPQTHD